MAAVVDAAAASDHVHNFPADARLQILILRMAFDDELTDAISADDKWIEETEFFISFGAKEWDEMEKCNNGFRFHSFTFSRSFYAVNSCIDCHLSHRLTRLMEMDDDDAATDNIFW